MPTLTPGPGQRHPARGKIKPMSIRVEPSRIRQTVTAFDSGVLIGHHPDKGTRVFTVDPEFDDDGTARITGLHGTIVDALARDPRVTIVWQPRIRHGWSLIVDGSVRADSPRLIADAGDDAALIIKFVSGMLHRPGAHADGPEWEWPEA